MVGRGSPESSTVTKYAGSAVPSKGISTASMGMSLSAAPFRKVAVSASKAATSRGSVGAP